MKRERNGNHSLGIHNVAVCKVILTTELLRYIILTVSNGLHPSYIYKLLCRAVFSVTMLYDIICGVMFTE